MISARWRVGSAAVALMAATLACGLFRPAPASPTPETAALAPTLAPVIVMFDGSEEAWRSLDAAVADAPAGVIDQARAHVSDPDDRVRLAAVYALSLAVGPEDIDVLLPALEDPQPGLRTIAAGALIGLGAKESIPVLIVALRSEEAVPGSHPPLPQWLLAETALVAYTGQDFGVGSAVQAGDASAQQAAVEAWSDWWQEYGAALKWDLAAERYQE